MGSLPTYDANVFTKPVPTAEYDSLFGPNSGDPQVNRAYQSVGPTGSTFKPITATAALESGAWTTGETFDDTGKFCISGPMPAQRGQRRRRLTRPRERDRGLLRRLLLQPGRADELAGAERRRAPEVGASVRDRPQDRDRPPRREPGDASRRGLAVAAQPAGGRVRQRHGPVQGQAASIRRAACGIADGTDRPWSIGDNESLAVGQGDVQVTPLQLAVVYSTIANGGTVVTPAHRGGRADRRRDRASLVQPAAPAPHQHRPDVSRHDPSRTSGRGLAAGRNLGGRVLELPRAGLRQDRHGPVHGSAGLRLVRVLRAAERDHQADRRRS